jgi:hypothetical protein
MASRSFCVALCRKQVFFVKTTHGEDYLEFVKGIREHIANYLNHGASTNSSPSEHLISYHPLDPEEVIQSLTLKLALLRLGSSFL